MAAPLIDGLRHPGEVRGPNGPVAYISLAVPVEQRHATVSVLSATSGLRTVSESSSQDSQHLRRPGLAQPEHPTTGTAGIDNIQAPHSRSIWQSEPLKSTTSGSYTVSTSSSQDSQHLQCPGFPQSQHPATTTVNIYSIRVSHNKSVWQLKLSASSASKLRTAGASINPTVSHSRHPTLETPNT